MAYCSVMNKEVELTIQATVKGGPNNSKKVDFYVCSGCYININGLNINKTCAKINDVNCLLKLK